MSEVTKYHQNVLSGFDNGCLLDLRVRLAIEFLKASGLHFDVLAETQADIAMDCATALLARAEREGFIDALPDDSGLNRQARLQAARMARYSVLQQLGMQKAGQEETSPVQQAQVFPAAPGIRFNG